MNPKWAEENLQTIRTLMERSALYRRALAPIMIYVGSVGIIGGIVGWKLEINSDCGFILFWMSAAALALTGSLLLVRRQALKDSEPFWSPPTRRIAQAMLPPCFIGLMVSAVVATSENTFFQIPLILGWTWLFGCAVHAAGFFMPRGIKWFGWLFISVGCGFLGLLFTRTDGFENVSPHLLMGGIFGGLHLAYGIYLYLTESRKTES